MRGDLAQDGLEKALEDVVRASHWGKIQGDTMWHDGEEYYVREEHYLRALNVDPVYVAEELRKYARSHKGKGEEGEA